MNYFMAIYISFTLSTNKKLDNSCSYISKGGVFGIGSDIR